MGATHIGGPGRSLRAGLLLAPALIGVPVLVGIASTLAGYLSNGHPDLRYGVTANSDAEALYLGETIYRDPVDGYTGQIYTPLFPFLVSLLHRIYLWAGWTITVNLLATLALAGLAAWLAYAGASRTGFDRLAAAIGAAGVGALTWWLVDCLRFSLLYEGRADHLAWAFAMFGFVLLAARGTGSPRALLAAAMLLSAAFWTKQTTVTAAVVAALWLGALAAVGATSWKPAIRFALALIVLNGILLAALNLATEGWQYQFAFEIGRQQPKFAEYLPSVQEFFEHTGLALGAAAVVGIAVLVRSGGLGHRGRGIAAALAGSRDARLASLMIAFAVLSAPLAIYFRTKVGGDVNAYVGIVWAVGMVFAVAYRRAQDHLSTMVVAAACAVVLFAVALRPGYNLGPLTVAGLGEEESYAELPPETLAYARSHLVWEQVHGDLNVEPQESIYTNFFNITDLLAAGLQPLHLVEALIDRRFDAVAPVRFPNAQTKLYWDLYTSGLNRYEPNYIWKLNEVIRAGYGPTRAPVLGMLERSPGPSRAPWMKDCFAPLDAGGLEFEIRRGGGFWCQAGADALALRRTPARWSEVQASGVQEIAGSLTVGLAGRSGRFAVAKLTRPGWLLRGRAQGALVVVDLLVEGRIAGSARLSPERSGRVRLELGESRSGRPAVRGSGTGAAVSLPATPEGVLSIRASRSSGARFDLGGLRR